MTAYYRSQDAQLAQLVQSVAEFGPPADRRLLGAQDLARALVNSPAFLFNHGFAPSVCRYAMCASPPCLPFRRRGSRRAFSTSPTSLATPGR